MEGMRGIRQTAPGRGRVGAVIAVAALAAWALIPAAGRAAVQDPPPLEPLADGAAFRGDGMWIWYVSKAEGGSPARIAARARKRGVETVFIKAGDGDDTWSQFTPGLVSELKARGLNVCAWQYVYGSDPAGEARVGAAAAGDGADCLVIDAESEYEGRYASATLYIERLRAAVGDDFPLGLAAFPYVHYHPAFPYSVFLAPGAAEFNLPQVYWKAIGTSVDKAMTTTYTYNRVYERPIAPIGQLYESPRGRDVRRFRQLAKASGFGGVSWWSWQHASPSGFRAATKRRVGRARGYRPSTAYPKLDRGATGDLVVWAQQYLAGGGWFDEEISGEYGLLTSRAVREFQGSVGLEPTGLLDARSWRNLLASAVPVTARWGSGAAPRGDAFADRPRSARLPAVEDELAPR